MLRRRYLDLGSTFHNERFLPEGRATGVKLAVQGVQLDRRSQRHIGHLRDRLRSQTARQQTLRALAAAGYERLLPARPLPHRTRSALVVYFLQHGRAEAGLSPAVASPSQLEEHQRVDHRTVSRFCTFEGWILKLWCET